LTNSFDLVCIGALNVDFVVRRSLLNRSQLDTVKRLDDSFEPGAEERISEADAVELTGQLDEIATKALGGSAYNVIRGVAAAWPQARLAYLGIAGSVPKDVTNFKESFASLLIDYQYVHEYFDEMSGRCFSYVYDNDRSMKVAPGANNRFMKVLDEKREQIIDLLSKTRHLHLTSLVSDGAPEKLYELLSHLRANFPALTISVDPGFRWCKKHRDIVLKIAELVDLLLLNWREFKYLAGASDFANEEVGAARILGAKAKPRLLVLLKAPEHLILFDNMTGKVRSRHHYPTDFLKRSEIVDDTGAGDAFAAGLLTSFIFPNLGLEDGVKLGSAFALETMKVSIYGITSYTKQFSKLRNKRY